LRENAADLYQPRKEVDSHGEKRGFQIFEELFPDFGGRIQLEAMASVPSVDFTFKTDPLETSKCDFGVMGYEVNGRYYETARG
jgi:hypothetical protein